MQDSVPGGSRSLADFAAVYIKAAWVDHPNHASRKLLGRIGDRLKTQTQAAHEGSAAQYAEVADQHGTADTSQFGCGRRTYADLRADARRIADHHSDHR